MFVDFTEGLIKVIQGYASHIHEQLAMSQKRH